MQNPDRTYPIPAIMDKPLAILGSFPKIQVFFKGENCIVAAVHIDDNYPEHSIAVWEYEKGLQALQEEILKYNWIIKGGSLFQPLWVQIEPQLVGDIAIESTDGDILVTYDSYHACEVALRSLLKDYQEEVLVGYDEQSFYPALFSPTTQLREDIVLSPEQKLYLATFDHNPLIRSQLLYTIHCSYCGSWEELPETEQRHHAQHFQWKKDNFFKCQKCKSPAHGKFEHVDLSDYS